MPRVQPTLAFCLLSLSWLADPSWAETRAWRVAPPSQGTRIEILVSYSLGTHTQTVREVRGQVRVDANSLRSVDGLLMVPISAINGDGGLRDCHMREALGLDYRSSHFPSEHVCDRDNELPASGPDAVVFRDLQFALKELRPIDDPRLLQQGKPVSVEIQGIWTIHGVSKPTKLVAQVSREGPAGGLRIHTREYLNFKDFDVVIKAARVLFTSITAGTAAIVNIDLLLIPVPL